MILYFTMRLVVGKGVFLLCQLHGVSLIPLFFWVPDVADYNKMSHTTSEWSHRSAILCTSGEQDPNPAAKELHMFLYVQLLKATGEGVHIAQLSEVHDFKYESGMSSIGMGLKPFILHFTCVCGEQNTACSRQWSAMWVPRTELWSSHLAVSTFTHQVSLLAPHVLFLPLIGWWCYFEKLWDP